MAEEKPIIDFGTAQRDLQQLINQLKQADATILKISQDALTAGRNLSSIQLPSDLAQFTAENQRLTAQIQAQSQALSQLQTQYNTLSTQRRTSSQRTAEESVNQGILNRNALESARINSTLAGAYMRLSAQQSQASRNLQDLIVRGRLATQTQREYDRELRTAQREFNTLNQRITAADRAVGRFNRNVGNYPMQAVRGIKDLLGAFGVAGGLALFASIAKDIFETTKEVQSLNMALKQVTETNELFAQSQAFLSRISEAYGANINDLTKQFTQFYVSAKDKISGRQIEQIFESITKAGSSMGLSAQQQEKAFLALNQMMSKGTIQAEELRGQLGEALPGSLGIMAKALGVTEQKLGEMMKAGELLASDVLPKFAKQLEITYGIENVKRIDNLASAQNRLTNAWINFVASLDEDGNKLSAFFAGTLSVVTKIVQGTTLLLQSEETKRANQLTKFRQDGYNQTMAYYTSLDELKKEDLENDKAYTQEKIDQEVAELNRLRGRNLILKAIMPEEKGVMNTVDYKALNAGKEEIAQNKEKIKALNNLISSRVGNRKAINELLTTETKAVVVNKEITKAELKAIEDRLKALYEANKKEIELELAKVDLILNNDDKYYTDRLSALDKDYKLRLQLAKLDRDEHFRLAQGDKNKQRSAEIDHQIALLSIADKYGKERIALEKLQLKSIEVTKTDPKKDALKESSENAIKLLEKQAESVKQLAELYKELQQNTNDWLGSFSSEFLQNSGLGSLETFFDGTFSKLLEGADTMEEKFAVTFNAIAESAQEAFNFISNVSQGNFDAEKERLQEQYDIALTYAGDNKVAQEKLAEDLEKSKKDIANREAKAKQKQAMFNIAIDTAQGIISALASTPPNVPLSIAIGVIGAAQLAMVASQEIPQYWMGGTHDGGLMMVNDGAGSNYQETIVTPDGKIMKPTGRNVIMDAPAGTEIFTESQWNQTLNDMLQGKGISMNMPQQYTGISKADMYEVMADTLGSQPKHYSNFDADGATEYIMKGGNKTILKTNRGNSRGIKFGG